MNTIRLSKACIICLRKKFFLIFFIIYIYIYIYIFFFFFLHDFMVGSDDELCDPGATVSG